MIERSFKWILSALVTLSTSLTFALGTMALPSSSAHAAPISGWDAGNIIADENFYTQGNMSTADIQAFLDSKGSSCKGSNCLKNYRGTLGSFYAGSCPKTVTGGTNLSAAEMIYRVSSACNISAKVLLVTLEKENSLVSSPARTFRSGATSFQTALGYGCPDTAPCDTQYYGVGNQLYHAAKQFNNYKLYPHSYRYKAGTTAWIGYNPKKSCGGTNVQIQNAATAGLYNYTPYQPNTAALAAGVGIGDSCSTYGNRNFYSIYTKWFGDSKAVTAAKPSEPAAPAPAPEPEPAPAVAPEPAPAVTPSPAAPTESASSQESRAAAPSTNASTPTSTSKPTKAAPVQPEKQSDSTTQPPAQQTKESTPSAKTAPADPSSQPTAKSTAPVTTPPTPAKPQQPVLPPIEKAPAADATLGNTNNANADTIDSAPAQAATSSEAGQNQPAPENTSETAKPASESSETSEGNKAQRERNNRADTPKHTTTLGAQSTATNDTKTSTAGVRYVYTEDGQQLPATGLSLGGALLVSFVLLLTGAGTIALCRWDHA